MGFRVRGRKLDCLFEICACGPQVALAEVRQAFVIGLVRARHGGLRLLPVCSCADEKTRKCTADEFELRDHEHRNYDMASFRENDKLIDIRLVFALLKTHADIAGMTNQVAQTEVL